MTAAQRLEFLVEEPSMEAFLRGLLPRFLPDPSGRTGIAEYRLTGETRVPIFASLPVSGGRHGHDSRLSPA